MVQAVIWQRLSEAERQTWMKRAIAGLNAMFPDVKKLENWGIWGQLVPHVQAISTLPDARILETNDWALLLIRAGYYLDVHRRYGAAEPLYLRGVDILWQSLGENHPSTQACHQNFQ